MKKQVVLTRKELNEYIDKQANIIIENMLKNKKKISENRKRLNTTERLTNRISESIMQKMGLMNESKQHISEAGHLYGHYEDGTPFTNSKDTWRGVKGTTFISHGEWSDPEIWYKGKELNASDIEDGLWSWYEEECSENNEQPTQQGYEQWLETQDLVGYLDDVLFGMSESKKRNSSKYINETIEYDDYGSISDALAQCGWAYSDCYDVHNRNTGQNGIRYIIEPYPNNLEGIKPMDVDEMKEKMVALLGQENVIFSEGQHRQAPEIKNLSMVVLEDEITEAKKKTLKESIYEEQWEDEIKMFFRDLNNGKAFVENDFVAVEWGHNQTDPRFIIYEYGDMRLRDDHFSKQHSRYLTDKEIGDIYWALKRFYNVNKDDTMPIIDNYGINVEN